MLYNIYQKKKKIIFRETTILRNILYTTYPSYILKCRRKILITNYTNIILFLFFFYTKIQNL